MSRCRLNPLEISPWLELSRASVTTPKRMFPLNLWRVSEMPVRTKAFKIKASR